MAQLRAGTITRVSLDELGGVSIYGDPATARVSYLSGAEDAEWDTAEALPVPACPDRLTVTWDVDGHPVSAGLEVIQCHYCALDDIRAYRETAYQLTETSDEDAFAARAMAEQVMERECHRFFVPVLREALVERTNCSAARCPVVMDGWPHDMRRIVACEYVSGGTAKVSCGLTGETVDVSAMRQGEPAQAVIELGCGYVPAEVADATKALAAWYLLPKVGPDNALSESTDSGVLRYVVGGVGGAATSLPAVNAAIERFGVREWNVR